MKNAFDIVETKERILTEQNKNGESLRKELTERGIFFVNLMASPGAGKTTTLVRTINALKDRYNIGVMEADVDSDVDAKTISETGVRVIQLHTGGSCHMDADMTGRGLDSFDTEGLDMVFLENIGNLVCPAEFDVGAHLKVMILSVPEGDDKPLKYPLMFSVSDIMLINKIDTAPIFDFDYEACKERAEKLNPNIKVLKISSATGNGFEEWLEYLISEYEQFKSLRV